MLISGISLCANAQSIRLTSDNKRTIEATTTEKISVLADAAFVKVGFNHTAETKDAAYNEIVRMGNKILKALADAGIAQDAIESNALSVNREEDLSRSEKSTPKIRFTAEQQWRVYVTATDAQKVIDVAVAAGANSVQGVEWAISDPQSLREKAYAAALSRAKEMAEQAATQAHVKLGELVSIVNGDESESFAKLTIKRNLQAVMVEAAVLPNLVLYPSKVEREATVTVVYAIAQ